MVVECSTRQCWKQGSSGSLRDAGQRCSEETISSSRVQLPHYLGRLPLGTVIEQYGFLSLPGLLGILLGEEWLALSEKVGFVVTFSSKQCVKRPLLFREVCWGEGHWLYLSQGDDPVWRQRMVCPMALFGTCAYCCFPKRLSAATILS